MGELVKLHAERWIENVFESGKMSIDVSTKGRVKFNFFGDGHIPCDHEEILTMEQMAELGSTLAIAYRKDDEDV